MDTRSAKQRGQAVEQSRWFGVLIMVGLISFGIVHLLIAVIAVQIAVSGGGGEASQQGAFGRLPANPFGTVLLIVVGVGLLALTVWQALLAATGYSGFPDKKRLFKRASSAGRAVVYLGLAISAFRTLTSGQQSGDAKNQAFTAKLMSEPFGRILMALVGVAVVAGGIALIYRGLAKKFTEDLAGGVSASTLRLGQIGYAAKGVAYTIVGILFVVAAITFDAKKAGGLDAALRTLRGQPFGAALLVLVALGIAAFGVYCFAWARHAKR